MISHYELAKICRNAKRIKSGCVSEVEYLITKTKGVTVIAFRGTEASSVFKWTFWKKKGVFDVLRDIRFVPWYDKDVGWSHSGFLKGAKGTAKDILKRKYITGPVVVTGHSMGGCCHQRGCKAEGCRY